MLEKPLILNRMLLGAQKRIWTLIQIMLIQDWCFKHDVITIRYKHPSQNAKMHPKEIISYVNGVMAAITKIIIHGYIPQFGFLLKSFHTIQGNSMAAIHVLLDTETKQIISLAMNHRHWTETKIVIPHKRKEKNWKWIKYVARSSSYTLVWNH